MSIQRYSKNPILVKENVPFKVNSIFNAAPIMFNGQTLLLCRVEMPTGRSSFVIARSDDGKQFKLDSKPCLTPEDHGDWYDYVAWGIEDARITQIDEFYYLVYSGYSIYMPVVMLARTKDFTKFEIIGSISEPSNKDAALFPEKINGYYWKIDRPTADTRLDMWISKSPDLVHWGEYRFLLALTPYLYLLKYLYSSYMPSS